VKPRDAANFALALSDRKKTDPAWEYAIRVMMGAAEADASEDDLKEAARQLDVAFRMDGLLGIGPSYGRAGEIGEQRA
jgi:hypothetical protein